MIIARTLKLFKHILTDALRALHHSPPASERFALVIRGNIAYPMAVA